MKRKGPVDDNKFIPKKIVKSENPYLKNMGKKGNKMNIHSRNNGRGR